MLADIVMLLHAAFVLFVVGGLLATWIGLVLSRPFARNPWFRGVHLAAILFVVAESVAGYECPLTVWENELRGTPDAPGFIARVVHAWLFWRLPAWVFLAAYCAFAIAVGITWLVFPPRRAS
jgi:Protein of Unknown function (DUF2784).